MPLAQQDVRGGRAGCTRRPPPARLSSDPREKRASGQTVKRGQEIAVSGMSGSAKTPKLHFEVRKNSAPVDPSTYLE